ncbi:carbohydrate kinase [Nocardioides mangrovicus]|uniref:Carbohydrate kinase n=1 Tax=Nocardioides mangrovicus TaxID=2478913 RepID=A0A3L8P458_9ACTN|nr:carbohydrate kinase family protein [Nocardioides mangrovicus]RLV50065.1 carbohydrate kinase [Nocardioides mangrovicus]
MARSAGAVLVIGGANLDRLARTTGPLQQGTSNPGTAMETAGGVGRNVAENLARLGAHTRLVAAVGDDAAGARILDLTQAAGVETVEVPWRGPTGSYTAILDQDGSLLAGVADMAATESISLDHVPRRWLADCAWLVLDGNLTAATLAHALRLAESWQIPVVLDPVSAPKAALVRPLLGQSRIHTLTPTLDELTALAGTDGTDGTDNPDDPDAAAAWLLERDVEVVWLRRGEAGSTLYRRGHAPETVRLPPVSAVDVTGAGDAMLAAYVDALWQGADLVHAAWSGAAAAALTVASPVTVRPDLSRELIALTLEESR